MSQTNEPWKNAAYIKDIPRRFFGNPSRDTVREIARENGGNRAAAIWLLQETGCIDGYGQFSDVDTACDALTAIKSGKTPQETARMIYVPLSQLKRYLRSVERRFGKWY